MHGDVVRWHWAKGGVVDSWCEGAWQVDCGGWSVWSRRGVQSRGLSVSLSIQDVLFDCLVHPLLSVKLDCFFLPLEEHGEWSVKKADSGLKPCWESIAEKLNEAYVVVSTLWLILSEVIDILFISFFSHANSCQLPLCCSLRIGVTEAGFELLDKVKEILEDRLWILSVGDCCVPVSEFLCLPISPYCGVSSL